MLSLREEVCELTLSERRNQQQIAALKEEIRELHRNKERTAMASEQSDYLKNIVVRIVQQRQDTKVLRSLVPVCATLLALSQEEVAAMNKNLSGS